MQFEAAKLEEELALLETLVRVLEGEPDTLVPDDDLARAVVALGNDAFEIRVLDRMVFHHDREALLGDVGGRALGDGPTDEGPSPFEAEVVVEPPRRVFLDHEHPGFRPVGVVRQPQAAEGLRGLRGGPLGAVRIERAFLMRHGA